MRLRESEKNGGENEEVQERSESGEIKSLDGKVAQVPTESPERQSRRRLLSLP